MEKLANGLFFVNDLLYRWSVHLVVLAAWLLTIILTPQSWTAHWFMSGIVVYLILNIIRVFQSGSITAFLKNLKDEEKQSRLGLLVGLNLCVILGVLSFVVILILTLGSKKQK